MMLSKWGSPALIVVDFPTFKPSAPNLARRTYHEIRSRRPEELTCAVLKRSQAGPDLRRTFRGPYRRRPRASSLLAWLRSDLQEFYGPEAHIGGPVAAPLLTALGICAGLELLAKYWSGCQDIERTVVKEFLTSVAGLSQPDAEALMQFRNSLAHGYALGARRRKDKKLFSFAIDTDHTTGAAVVVSRGSNEYTVNLWSLKRFFFDSNRPLSEGDSSRSGPSRKLSSMPSESRRDRYPTIEACRRTRPSS